MSKNKIGLVLSGGGIRGLAHAGVLKALEELKIPIHAISGSSSGALVGLLYAGGIRPDSMISVLNKSKLFKLRGISFDLKSLMSTTPFREIIKENLTITTFEELKFPVTICVTDFTHAKSVYFNTGNFMEPLLASCSVPVIFSPVFINGNVMADGGLLNNLPVEPLIEKCDKIIGVHVNPIKKYGKIKIRTVVERCFQMAIMSNTKLNSTKCDLFIEPQSLSNYSVFDTKHTKEIFESGYNSAMEKKNEILRLID